ncbi:MAG TPA: hypothetical protein VFR65_11365 [Nitrososphaeraceae archaeon]|nr:hypothetical protein [Nitrososphaeraceae archaeon]
MTIWFSEDKHKGATSMDFELNRKHLPTSRDSRTNLLRYIQTLDHI